MSRKRRKLRLVLLTHEDLMPPDSVQGLSKEEMQSFRTEWDVLDGLRELGHEIEIVGISDALAPLRISLRDWRPHAVFNLLEEFHDQRVYSHAVVSYLELMRVPYTGCNPRGLNLTQDKALSKKILQHHRIRVPKFQTFPLGRKPRRHKRLQFPLIVKSLVEEASEGISEASVVHNDERLLERISFVHRNLGPAIVEQYIPGREVYCGVMGHRRLEVLPLWELHLENLRPDAPNVATRRVKWDLEYQKKVGLKLGPAEGLSDETVERIRRVTKRAYQLLDMSGWGRIDFRVTEAGEPYFLEANPNADIARNDEFAGAAAAAGYSYPELLQRILNIALRAAGK